MVSIDGLRKSVDLAAENPQLDALVSTLSGCPLTHGHDPEDRSVAGVCQAAAVAITCEQRDAFGRCLEQIAQRHPTVDSPWIYDDVLAFILGIGVNKFSLGQGEVKGILDLRRDPRDEVGRGIRDSLRRIAEGHFQLSSPFGFVDLAAQSILSSNEIADDALTAAFDGLCRQDQLQSHPPFLHVIAEHSLMMVLRMKGLDNYRLNESARAFVGRFRERCRVFGTGLYVAAFLALLVAEVLIVYGAANPPGGSNTALTVLKALIGAFGLGGLIGALRWRSGVTRWTTSMLIRLFGGSTELSTHAD